MTDTTNTHDFPHSATYSPEDDKLRIYPAHRLDAEEYAKAKAAGFRWAPMQELFFAVWSPAAEDVALALAGINPGDVVLEPSAGSGNIVAAVLAAGAICHAVEENGPLCDHIRRRCPSAMVSCDDFLQLVPGTLAVQYDAVVMNPPFSGAVDIKHIRHALHFLRPGGRLVAVCANGPRQREALQGEAEHWEDLPAGTFQASGTMVNTAALVITKN